MMLSDQDLREALAAGDIRFSPPVREEDIRPTGIRLHLSAELLIPEAKQPPVDITGGRQAAFTRTTIGPSGLIFQKGAFALGGSIENFSADADLVCQIDGRSTLARLGLMIHCSSTTFDHIHGEARSVTFELVNLGGMDLCLRAGAPVALASFIRLSSPVVQQAYGQYSRQAGPTPPLLGYFEPTERKR
jgi:dCTP deaminase